MNTSKRKQKAIRLGIAAVLALVLLVAVSVVLVIANEPETVQADAMTVTLDGKVNLIFKFNDGKVKSGTVSYYRAVIGESGRRIERLEPVKDVENRDVVTVPLMPYEMTETVSLYHVAEDGAELAVSKGSVKDYADKVLASNDDAAHHNKIRALLNYGAKTQIDAEKNTSNLANNGLFVRNDPIDIIKEVPFGALDEKTGDTKYFEDKASVSLAFKGGDILLRYTVNGVDSAPTATFTYNEENHIGTFVPQEDGSYKFDISNVGVNNFDTVWDVTITSGEHKITSHHSVLEYLNYLVTSTDEKITAEEKDVARSLYQLYQNTAGSLLADCKHLNPGYYIPADANSSYLMCAACGKQINDEAIDNKVTAYFSAKHLSGIQAFGDVNATYSEGNGYQITWKTAGSALELIWLREAYYTSGSLKQADGKWGDVPFDIGNAKYLVIRYKVNAGSGITGIYAYLGSTEWTAEDTLSTGAEGQGSVYSYQKTTLKNGDADCTTILYLDDFGDKVAADENGNRVIDGLKLGIAGSAKEGDTLTIESIEFFTGEIQHGNMKTTMTEGVPSTVCTVCNRPVLPENTVIDGNFLAQATVTNSTVSTEIDGDNIYYHATTTTATEHLWFREPYRNITITENTISGGAGGKLNATHNVPGFTTVTDDKKILANGAVVSYFDYPALNVGTARYLVIRARTNFTGTSAFYLYMGTVGFHNPEKNAAAQRIGVRFNTANDGNWMTYVLDLEKVANFEINGEKRAPTVKDANGNDILIFDSFYLGLPVGDMDIDYIAFVNGLSDVADITEDASVRIMNDVTSGASTLTNTADLKN